MALYLGSDKVCPTILPSLGGVNIPLEVSNGTLQKPTTSFSWSLPINVTDLGDYALQDAFKRGVGLTSVDLSSLTTISGRAALRDCFAECPNLESVDLSNLTTISGITALYEVATWCPKFTNINLSKLAHLQEQNCLSRAFMYSTSLTTLSFPALTSTSFGSYTNHFNNMLSGVTGCTVHFPSNLQSVIGSWSDVTAGFGGTNTTILFDLPATT